MIAAKVANALALDYPRDAARGHRRLRRLRPTRTAGARARGRRRRRARAAARRQGPRAGRRRRSARRGEIVAFSDANALWEPDALRALVAAVRRPARRLRLRAGALRQRRGRHQPGGPLLALRDGGCAALESRLRSVTAGNGAIYATRREAYLVVDPVMGHDLSFPFNMVKRGWRAVYAPARAGEREDGPDDRGRVRAQAADDEPRLADRPARRHALAARLPAALRADDPLATACCATRRRSCTSLALAASIALVAIGAGAVYVVALALQVALLAAALLARGRPRARRCWSRATTC